MLDHTTPRIFITAPGQGCQHPGMLDAWVARDEGRDVIEEWSLATGLDLLDLSRSSVALQNTAIAQPVLTATALVSWHAMQPRLQPGSVALCAGHSVGELAAASVAGHFSAVDAIRLAHARGLAMAAACAEAPTGMVAVTPSRRDGADDHQIVTTLREAGLELANVNGAHEFIAAGPSAALSSLIERAPAGMRLLPLAVAGAFHTAAMSPAVQTFARALDTVSITSAATPLIANADGEGIVDREDLKRRLVRQVDGPVRWDLCSAKIAALSQADTTVIELAPGGPLTRLASRTGTPGRLVRLATPDDVEHLVPVVTAAVQ